MNRLYSINHGIDPDAKDVAILDTREAEWNARPGPRTGDFVKMGQRYGRFSHEWDSGLQWSEDGSFYFGGAYVSFSGGLNSEIPLENLEETNETKEGRFWFFHHGFARAHSGVGAAIPCRVYKAKTKTYTVTAEGRTWSFEAVNWSDAWSHAHRLNQDARKAAGLNYYEYHAKDMTISPGPEAD